MGDCWRKKIYSKISLSCHLIRNLYFILFSFHFYLFSFHFFIIFAFFCNFFLLSSSFVKLFPYSHSHSQYLLFLQLFFTYPIHSLPVCYSHHHRSGLCDFCQFPPPSFCPHSHLKAFSTSSHREHIKQQEKETTNVFTYYP